MRLLLDTQIYLWWLADSRKLAKATRERIEGGRRGLRQRRVHRRVRAEDLRGLARGRCGRSWRAGSRPAASPSCRCARSPAAAAASLKPVAGRRFLRSPAGRSGHERAAAIPYRQRGAEAVLGARRSGLRKLTRGNASLAPQPTRSDVMSKGMDQKKSLKKKAAKSFDEKRAAKKAKKAEKQFLQRP